MAKHVIKIKNCAGGFYWISRPASKMNNKELSRLGKTAKKFAKRYSSKKTRFYLNNETRKEESY